MSIYLYAYTLADSTHNLQDVIGVDQRRLFLVTCGDVSAVVSSYSSDKLLVRGKDIFAHQQVLRHLMDEASVIPLQFGLTLQDLSTVEEVLLRNHDSLRDQLNRIYRKVEMEVTMKFDVEDLLDYMLDRYPYLRDEKAKVTNGKLIYYLGDRARKGEKFQSALKKEKEVYASKLEEVIGPWCAEIEASHLPLGEKDVVTFNCLVNRERLKVFERAVHEAGDLFSPDFHFTYNGPWAPQNFCLDTKIRYSQ